MPIFMLVLRSFSLFSKNAEILLLNFTFHLNNYAQELLLCNEQVISLFKSRNFMRMR